MQISQPILNFSIVKNVQIGQKKDMEGAPRIPSIEEIDAAYEEGKSQRLKL